MSTYGDIRQRIVKECPGVDLKLIDGYITDRYVSILDKLQWSRIKQQYTFQTVAPYQTGTLSLTNGSNVVALTGGTFTSAMTGRTLLITERSEPYVFTYTGAAAGTLDRPYEGDTKAGLSYKLLQAVYPLPANTRVFENGRLLDSNRPLDGLSRAQANVSMPSRSLVGAPAAAVPALDSSTDPPQMQIELIPAPDGVYAIAVDLTSEAPTISGTGVTLLPWLRPSALVAGASADAYAHLKNWDSATYWKNQAAEYLADMKRTEHANSGPMSLQLSGYFTAHRRRRGCR